MTSRIIRNQALHTNLFAGQPFERHAFVVQAPTAPVWESGDYTTSDCPIAEFYAFNRVPTGVGWEGDNATTVLGGPEGPTMVPGWVSPDDVTTLLRQAPPGTRFVFNSAAMETAEQAKQWLDAARVAASAQMPPISGKGKTAPIGCGVREISVCE